MNLFALCSTVVTAGIACIECTAQRHPFTVKDDIEMTRFSDPRPIPGRAHSEVAQRSPNGKHFAVVTTRGDLKSDRLESRILIFDSGQARTVLASRTAHLAAPRVIATCASFPHHQEGFPYASVIKDLRWSLGSTHVYFKGEGLNGSYRLYEAEIGQRNVHALTPANESVTQYDVAGKTIVYRAEDPPVPHVIPDDQINPDARAVTGDQLKDVLFPQAMAHFSATTSALHVVRKINGVSTNTLVPESSVREKSRSSNEFSPFTVSPDGRKFIELSSVPRIPPSWEAYEPAQGFEWLRYRSSDPRLTSNANFMQPRRYTLVALKDGKRIPLVDGPNGFTLGYNEENRVVWSKDSRRVLITDTFLPLDNVSGRDRSERLRPCAVASVEVRTRDVHCLVFIGSDASRVGLKLESLSFGANNDEVVLHADIAAQRNVVYRYRYRDGDWEVVAGAPQDGAQSGTSTHRIDEGLDLEVAVRQSLNDPPTLWVTDIGTGESRELWNPNPQFAHIRFANVSPYHWKDRTGYEWSGGLVKPLDYIPGKQYPLVLQMYEFIDSQFMTDGDAPTAFAARHLASDGIAVLEIAKKPSHTFDDAEAQDHLEGYRSAIEQLSRDGLIDADKVGAVGFSWTCWYVENALIKAPHMFRAATIADGVDHSYMQYHLYGESNLNIQEQDDKINGAQPFGDGLMRWLAMAPGFHLDQIQVPLRIEAINPDSFLGEWEIYSSLRMQGKPVDLIYFPFGTHVHQRPLERLESQQGDVDWFRFWLQGYEDPDPAKRNQYRRWEHLHSMNTPPAKPTS